MMSGSFEMHGPFPVGLGGFLLGLIGFAVVAIIEYGAWALVLPPRGRRAESGSAEDGEPLSAVAVDGARLAGRWFPATVSSRPGDIVVLLHGFAETSHELQAERAGSLRAAGWNVAALDSRGYGDSGGPLASFGGREASDVTAWLDVFQARLAPAQHFMPILWGRSMGAAIALRAAALDSRIRALILESPMLDLDDAMAVWFRNRRFPLPRLLAMLVTRRASRIAGVSLTRPNALELAPRVRCPILILHGDDDTLVPSDQARRLERALPSDARFLPVPGAGHTDVLSVGAAPLLGEVIAFLEGQRPEARIE